MTRANSHYRACSIPCPKPAFGRDLRALLSTVGGSEGGSKHRNGEYRVSVCICVYTWGRGRGARARSPPTPRQKED